MSLQFEKKVEIKLSNPPLDDVICQIKFLPILSISRDVPIEFQEKVRNRFPKYDIVQSVFFQIPGVASTEKPKVEAPSRTHSFKTIDNKNEISLAPDFIALSSKQYFHWERFQEDLTIMVQAAQDTYHLTNVIRIGLRFINRFTMKNTGCKSQSELLNLFRNEIICLIDSEPWKNSLEMFSQVVIPDQGAKMALRTGYGKFNTEKTFVVDLDYFEESNNLTLDDFLERIIRYHDKIYDAFRWTVKDESLQRFNPIDI